MPMSAVDRIRAMQAKGIDIGGSAPRPPAPPSPYGQPSGSLHDSIQQDFSDSMAPQPQPTLPPDSDLNAPVQWHKNPLTGQGYMPKQNIRG
jgi:hypothetical protein